MSVSNLLQILHINNDNNQLEFENSSSDSCQNTFLNFLDTITLPLSTPGIIPFNIEKQIGFQNYFAFQSKIIQLYEENLFDEKNYDFCTISNNSLTIDYETISSNDDQLFIDTLTYASSEPWNITPNYNFYTESEAIDITNNNAIKNISRRNADFLITNDLHRFDDALLTENFMQNKLEHLEIECENLNYVSPVQILHECNECDFSINSDINIAKYESLSNVVHSQIINKIELHSLSDNETLEISLYPETLGNVKIKCLKKNEDKIIIHISVEKLSTLSLLQNNAHDLKESILRNFSHNSSTETELKFDMQQHNHQKNNSFLHFEIATNTEDNEHKQSVMYFYHNGIISFSV